MQTKTGRDLPIEEVTKDNYVVPAGEEKVFHARIEVKKFDSNTGQRQSIPRIQKFGSKSFKTILSNLKKQGYTVDILHDPSEYLAEQKQLQSVSVAERAKKNKEAAEAKKQAELDALKAELRAELLAELKADIKTPAPAAKKEETAKKEEVKPAAAPGALPTKK